MNNQPLSDLDCNPNGERKFQAGYVDLQTTFWDGYCVNFEVVAYNYNALPPIYLWVYGNDENNSYGYFVEYPSSSSSSKEPESVFW